MPRHIGIAAVSPEGAALFYRSLSRRLAAIPAEELAPRDHPRISIHNEPLGAYIDALQVGDWMRIGGLLRRSAEKLAGCGAEFCLTPDNAVQHAIQLAEVGSPIPWLTITDLVAESVVAARLRTVGLIGTRLVMAGSTYQTVLGLKGIHVLTPDDRDAEAINAIIFNELIYGRQVPESQRKVMDIIATLGARGCEGVILGCSEAPLLVTAEQSPLPVFDAVAVLAEGAAQRALVP
ncbi:MAG: amino acid racemase [Phycisphaerales bacterium]|nr:amino acid racemase [Phycisphaerales bacterium]